MTIKNEFGQPVIIDQWMPIAKKQEAVTDAAYEAYNEAAAKLQAVFDEHKKAEVIPDPSTGSVRVVYVMPKDSKGYNDYLLASFAKDEAFKAWQREANKHGRMLHPAEMK